MVKMRRLNVLTTCGVVVAVALVLAVAGGCEKEKKELALTTDEQAALGKIKSIAIVPFADAIGPNKKGSGQIAVSAATEFAKAPGLRAVERAQLSKLVEESELKMLFNDTAKAVDLGKKLGVDAVVLGEVSQYDAQKESSHISVPYFGGGGTRTEHRVGLGVRVVRVADAEIIYSRTGNGSDTAGFAKAAKKAAREALGPWREYYVRQEELKRQPPAAPASK